MIQPMQTLESRVLFATTPGVTLDGGTLRVLGTTRNDAIVVSISGSTLRVNFNGTTKSFAVADVRKVSAELDTGSDLFDARVVNVKCDVEGDAGNDVIYTGSERATVDGGAGNDRIFTGKERDDIDCDDGKDYVEAGEERDSIDGGDGNDTLNGGLDSDTIFGGDGDDDISSGDPYIFNLATNRIEGGKGNDLIDVLNTSFRDFADGQDGVDVIRFDKTNIGVDVEDKTKNWEFRTRTSSTNAFIRQANEFWDSLGGRANAKED